MKIVKTAALILIFGAFLTACGWIENIVEGAARWIDEGGGRMSSIDVVFVEGGYVLSENMTNIYGQPIFLQDFYIGRFEVTQREWLEVMEENPSMFIGNNLPVERVSWYDAVVFLNRRSERAGLEPFYNIDKETPDPNNHSEVDDIRWTITINPDANGYRLPTEIEWEYAAGGGQLTRGYIYSGSNDLFEVGWIFRNSGDEFLDGMWHWPTLEENNGRTHPVGQLAPNELGIYDMTGNVREWTFNWNDRTGALTPPSGYGRSVRGGGWVGGEEAAQIDFRNYLSPHFAFEELGFRVARNAG